MGAIKLGGRCFRLPAVLVGLMVLSCLTASWGTTTCYFRNVSPLPGGGGIAVTPDGEIDGSGACQINIPIAYTPKCGYVCAGGYVGGDGSTNRDFDHFTGFLGGSVSNSPRLYLSVLEPTTQLDKIRFAACGQLLLLSETSKQPAIAIGVQDAFHTIDCEASPYITATKRISISDHKVYLTLGYGGRKFDNSAFYGISVPLSPNFNIAGGSDGGQWNGALIWRPGGVKGMISFLGGYNGTAGWLGGVGITIHIK